jgi:hypothetical protein
VLGGDPAAHFLTMWKEIEDEPKIDQGCCCTSCWRGDEGI